MTHAIRSQHSRLSAWTPALLGPVALGVATGAAWGLHETTKDALALPTIVLSVTAIMTPALYIGANIIGVQRSASQVASATLAALRSSGLVMAGLAPAVGFLLISSGQTDGSRLLAALVAEAAAVLGIWTTFEHLQLTTKQGFRSTLMLIGWTLVAVLLNAHLLGQWLIA